MKYATFEKYWETEKPKYANSGIMEQAFREIAEKAWNAARDQGKEETTYPNGEVFYGPPSKWRFHRTGEFRKPMRGDWYLSGAIPCAYMARANLDTNFHILERVV